MKLSSKSLYSYKKDIVSVKNMYYTVSFHSDDDEKNTVSIDKLKNGLSRIIEISKKLQTSISEIFSFHTFTLTELLPTIDYDDIDSFDFELCMNTVGDLLNNINIWIKEEQGYKPTRIKQYWDDNDTLYYENEDSFKFDVRFVMYDRKFGIDYAVFTDYYDRDDEYRYFIATVVPLDDENVLLFPVSSKEKEHYIEDIKIFDEELFDEVNEILDYFDFYY